MTRIGLETTAIEDVRALCTRKKWYTRGNNQEYSKLFEMVESGAAIMDIADDIYMHSSAEYCSCVGAVYQELELFAAIWKSQLKNAERRGSLDPSNAGGRSRPRLRKKGWSQ